MSECLDGPCAKVEEIHSWIDGLVEYLLRVNILGRMLNIGLEI